MKLTKQNSNPHLIGMAANKGGLLIGKLILLGVTSLTLNAQAEFYGAPPREVFLEGTAQGGVLNLALVRQFTSCSVSITTTTGESAESVMKRMADEINRTDAFYWNQRDGHIRSGSDIIHAEAFTNCLLLLGPSDYVLSGTDRGFNIPQPVFSFSGSYDPDKKQIVLTWINPSETCDQLQVGRATLPPDATKHVLELSENKELENDRSVFFPKWFGAIRRSGKTVSPPASINLRTNSEEELDAFPFHMGVAPNWCGWTSSETPHALKFEQRTRTIPPSDSLDPIPYIRQPDDKPFYQIIKTTQAGAQGGTWRRFLGLKPGHTYQVDVRLNTLKMDEVTNDWAYSFHAAYDYPGGKGLTTNQLAGLEALPDGSKGPAAARVALYGPGNTTKGAWVKRSSGEPNGLKNITLPPEVTSITVWLRHSGANSTGVGMDWIKLTDLTPPK